MPRQTEPSRRQIIDENKRLKEQIDELQETFRAIRRDEVDALVINTISGDRVFTLKGADQSYRVLIEQMKEGAVMLSEDNTILYSNDSLAKIVRVALSKIIGIQFTNFIPPSHQATFCQMMNNCRKNKKPCSGDMTILAYDGSLIPTYVSVNILPEGETSALCLVFTDLSDHMEKQLKEYSQNLEKLANELKSSEEKCRHLLQYAPTAIYELDYKGLRFKSVNDAMCEMTGYSRKELLQKNPMDMHTPESQERFRDRVNKILAGERIDEAVEFTVIVKDGKELQVVLYVTPTYKEGKLDGALVVGYDVTERKKAEERLREVEKFAAIGRTAAMVGHDLRNPLQAMVTDINLTEEELERGKCPPKLKKDFMESLRELNSLAFYMDKIVSDLQDYARPIKPNPLKTDLNELMKDTLSTFDIPENVSTAIKVPQNFPKVNLDPAILRRVLSNLINNALQAMPDGGKLALTASKREHPLTVQIEVEDTGVGIKAKDHHKIFEPLFTTKPKGQGLGLPASKKLVEALGGTINFKSRAGKTKFTINFPEPTGKTRITK